MEASKNRRNLNDELRQMTGSDTIYRHPSRNYYTDSIQYIAETFECFWLIDDILWYNTPQWKRWHSFQVWKLERIFKADKPTANFKLICDDGNGLVIYQKEYISDFTADHLKLYFEHETLLLPSER